MNSPLCYLPSSLTSLSLYRPNIKDSSLLIQSLSKLANLSHLSLFCVECLDNKTLTKLLENIGPQLTLLNLTGYMALAQNQLSDDSVKHIVRLCPNLNSICFDMFSSTATLDSLQSHFDNNSIASKYEAISLRACRNIKANLLLKIALNCLNLRKLELSGLNQLVNDALLKSLALTTTKLEFLDIKGCNNVTDDSICLLAVNCARLRVIDLSGICLLTDKCVFTIANHLQFSLEEIYISGCSRISRVALRYLRDCCINRLYYEHNVPNADPNQLMAKNLDTGDFVRVDLPSLRF